MSAAVSARRGSGDLGGQCSAGFSERLSQRSSSSIRVSTIGCSSSAISVRERPSWVRRPARPLMIWTRRRGRSLISTRHLEVLDLTHLHTDSDPATPPASVLDEVATCRAVTGLMPRSGERVTRSRALPATFICSRAAGIGSAPTFVVAGAFLRRGHSWLLRCPGRSPTGGSGRDGSQLPHPRGLEPVSARWFVGTWDLPVVVVHQIFSPCFAARSRLIRFTPRRLDRDPGMSPCVRAHDDSGPAASGEG